MFPSGRTIKSSTYKHMGRSSDPDADEDSLPMFGGHNTVELKCLTLRSAIHLWMSHKGVSLPMLVKTFAKMLESPPRNIVVCGRAVHVARNIVVRGVWRCI